MRLFYGLPELRAERVQEKMRSSAGVTTGLIDKARFENYLALLHKIARKNEELKILQSKLSNPASPKLSDLPKSPNKKNDKIDFLIQEKMEIESDLDVLNKYRETERRELNSAILTLENPENSSKFLRDKKILVTEASILRLRYLCMFSWEEINETIYSGEPDFEEKKEDFQRKVFRYHGNAFIDFRKIY